MSKNLEKYLSIRVSDDQYKTIERLVKKHKCMGYGQLFRIILEDIDDIMYKRKTNTVIIDKIK